MASDRLVCRSASTSINPNTSPASLFFKSSAYQDIAQVLLFNDLLLILNSSEPEKPCILISSGVTCRANCPPHQILNYEKDIKLWDSKRWATLITPAQFQTSTKLTQVPEYLKNTLNPEGQLAVFSNGQIDYQIRGHFARVKVTWAWQAEPGAGDTHYSIMRGTNASLVIRQGVEQGYQPVFSVETNRFKEVAYRNSFERVFREVAKSFPGISYILIGNTAVFDIPNVYKEGHEAHFARVTEKYLDFLSKGKMPEWEVPNMLVKYKLTTEALNMAIKKSK